MAKKVTPPSAYQIFEDLIVLAGSFAKLSRTIATQKIQSSADAASEFVNDKVDLSSINARLSDAKESLGQASDYATNTDLKQMVDDAAVFVRKHPVATLVSVVAAGALITQMLRPEPVAPAPVAKRAKPAVRKTKSRVAKIPPKSRAKANGLAREHA
jgi:ElaB/YqjD/DUF883 family membrane-anchored ribosome-binding protein